MVPVGSRELIPQLDQLESNRADVITPAEAESLLIDLAAVFLSNSAASPHPLIRLAKTKKSGRGVPEGRRDLSRSGRAIPAVIFMAHLDRGIGEAYVSPQLKRVWAFLRKNGWRIHSLVSANPSR